MTDPTTRPWSPSAASVAAKGTRIWATTDVVPTMASAAASTSEARRRGGGEQGQRGDRQQQRHEAAALDEVAERDDEQQPGGVAELADGHEQPGRARADAEVVRDRVQQRLHEVHVRDGEPAGQREQQHEAAARSGGGCRRRAHTFTIGRIERSSR